MPIQKKPITVVQGGQYGSEAKGAIAAYLCETEGVDYAVRTGATNAGHTVYYKGHQVKMQQLPVGWVNPNCGLVLGAGSLIDVDILHREIETINHLTGEDVRSRLWIDANAGIHSPIHAERSKASGRHVTMGATGKGSSEALMDKIRGRGEGYRTWGQLFGTGPIMTIDTSCFLNFKLDRGAKVLVEGTQGTLLDLHLGPYPYTTHKQTQVGNWLAECGLSCTLPLDVVMVVRTYPIRVAGNSGPLPAETSWPILARAINRKRDRLDLPPIVRDSAINEFDIALAQVMAGWPEKLPSEDMHQWTAEQRVKYKRALSELNKQALELLPAPTMDEVSKLFEMTTVTRKLRRVANQDWAQLRLAGMFNRPHRVALTFMNYEYPQYWYELPPDNADATGIGNYMRMVEDACGAEVRFITWGPESGHILKRGL